MTKISGWGNYPIIETKEASFDRAKEVINLIKSKDSFIARGNARSYGDSALYSNTISSQRYNRMLAFNEDEGIFTCEAGVLFSEILDVVVPKGWFLPVTPGTKFITVGGAIASDIHGKNHHKEGSFSQHLMQFELACADGTVKTCSREENSDLFEATCGGMGLTGVILTATFKLKAIETAYINQTQTKAKNLDEIIDLFQQHEAVTYSMAWIDCLKGGKQFGRSILITGEHATKDELSQKQAKAPLHLPEKKKLNIPFNFPSFALNEFSIKAFNALYYAKNIRRVSSSVIPYEPFFYPLDAILNWNRMYGKKGFVQYQFVLPLETSKKGLTDILERIRKKGLGSFLAVLKLFGEQEDLISFPMKGFTLALDFPIKKGLFEFLDELDKVVVSYGGRIYLTKDARMDAKVFWETYPHIDKFVDIVKKYNPQGKFTSLQSQRLLIK
ncbi:FAD-binding oxidoreductase [Fulvivirga sp. RKSG066]|uniref:FAD-binding oxidoreductase n=1 Tax=Fulvivirga aurantia TaxID=2529383 RepID=UPI0012BC0B40|nr:FAD-binding oxidoreductase [Fulvivirga aurantia]MTI20658.1 FAD-binding oxidoreductase [Fulvivirga aurantia]